MSDTLFESIGVPDSVLFADAGSLNVIHQVGEKIDAGFFNHFAFARFAKKFVDSEENAKVLLVLTHHSKSHWASIGNKLGVNVTSMLEKGSLAVVDLLKDVFDLAKAGESVGAIENVFSVQHIYTQCEKIIQTFKDSGCRKILVVIETLNNLLELEEPFQHSEKQIMELLYKFKSLSTSSFEKDKCSLTVNCLVHSPPVSQHSKDQYRFAVTVAQVMSAVSFEVSSLSTGFSSQITGLLKVRCNPDRISVGGQSQFMRSFHFKLDNNTIRPIPF